MSLNEEGIARLEKIMLANGKYFYDQAQFGLATGDCGAVLCAAGFAHLLRIGEEQLAEEVKRHTERFSIAFCVACERDGAELLGLDPETIANISSGSRTLQIFSRVEKWPYDLQAAWEKTATAREKISLYIDMLRNRAQDDGSIREKGERP